MQRRSFLTSIAAGLLVQPSWADTGGPRLLTAAIDERNRSWLIGLSGDGQEVFRRPIPSRGHAAAAHPHRPVAVAFARRPGQFAVILDCASGQELGRLTLPEGRHFYGHGAFTADGQHLLTTENAYDTGDGRIGIWDVADGYERIAEVPSGGIGPHEIIRLPDGSFAVANGGIQTHPGYGRAKLNLPDMRPNLAYLAADGTLLDMVEPPAALRQNSIRHIDCDATGRIVAAMQWQGHPLDPVPLAALHRRGDPLQYLDHPETVRLKQYAGSVAMTRDGTEILVTGPKGDHLIRFDGVDGSPRSGQKLPLASGVAAFGDAFAVTFKGGIALAEGPDLHRVATPGALVWDNHLVSVS
ncbi:DUF1513 domain-containing protein [Falsiphaeobacter marinintestinus]|uniref:DUF1513 domain-containing protein n=1 Tax=Falsiphaeobacter marinintestinus TaxID=1492905 RepID=UPI0016487555|nr:DUF1513 domain-containing protein [Phaeobacter marinintestinus]